MALGGLTRAATKAKKEADWQPIKGWWQEWEPTFEAFMKPDEYQRMAKVVRPPPEREGMMTSRGKWLPLDDDPLPKVLAQIRSTLKGLINKYDLMESTL